MERKVEKEEEEEKASRNAPMCVLTVLRVGMREPSNDVVTDDFLLLENSDYTVNLGYNEFQIPREKFVTFRYSLRRDLLKFLCKIRRNRSLLLLRHSSSTNISPISI